eukprot:2064987-Ditylum_brightwellii.AAC.1
MSQWLLGKIKDRDTGLKLVSILDIFNHVFDFRGQINDDLVDEYTSKYNFLANLSQGFNTSVKCQEECRGFFEAAEQPITSAQLAAKGQLHVGQTGLSKEKYLTWKKRDNTLKIWSNFKIFWNH